MSNNNNIGEPILEFKTNFKDYYIRTRHNNLRCFPSCAKVHVDNRFCGRAIEITVSQEYVPTVQHTLLVGEMTKLHRRQRYEKGDRLVKSQVKGENLLLGEYVRSNTATKCHYYIFDPPRKWCFRSGLRDGDVHLLTIYFCMNDIIIQTLNSPPFRIIPVWKTRIEKVNNQEDDESNDGEEEDDDDEEEDREAMEAASSSSKIRKKSLDYHPTEQVMKRNRIQQQQQHLMMKNPPLESYHHHHQQQQQQQQQQFLPVLPPRGSMYQQPLQDHGYPSGFYLQHHPTQQHYFNTIVPRLPNEMNNPMASLSSFYNNTNTTPQQLLERPFIYYPSQQNPLLSSSSFMSGSFPPHPPPRAIPPHRYEIDSRKLRLPQQQQQHAVNPSAFSSSSSSSSIYVNNNNNNNMEKKKTKKKKN